MATTGTLAIEHDETSSPPTFTLTRFSEPIKSAAPVEISSPYEFPVAGQPNSNLMRELRWYLEKVLDYPFHPDTIHSEHVLDALQAWGTQAFNALFDRRDADKWLAASSILQIRSDDPHILSWPWEALFDPQVSYLAHGRRIERRLNKLPDPPPAATLPSDRVNILLVVARPYPGDVRYRSIARPLVELIKSKNLPAHVDVLRPPTFDQLREQLRTHPGYYHVLHFDGHGAYRNGAGEYSPHHYQGPHGRLVFENEQGEPDPKSARDLSALLNEYALPAVVLNACQSATLDGQAADAFASVATALLRSGMRSVVAMAYSLYVSGAQVFLPAFYRRLFEAGSVAEAVRAGRQEMLAHKDRVCARGRYPLEDWILPVLYQQDPFDFGFVAQVPDLRSSPESHLPAAVLNHRDDYGFVGRDGPILELERALHRAAPAILVQGLGGVGKTTLARGFLRWLDDTGGLDAAQWFDFRDIRTAEYVINQTGEQFYGENFRLAPNKLELLTRALTEKRVLIVWDNFESTDSNLTAEDRAEVGRFLDAIRGTRGKVIITSRSREEWLRLAQRFELPLRGLDGEERWEYCDAILHELGLKVDRDDPALSGLMDQLAGHPLAMRVVLPKLEQMSAAKIAEALRTNIAELGLDEQEEQGRLFATLRFVEQGLEKELRPLLGLVGLHEGYVSASLLEAMARQVDANWTRERIDRLMGDLCKAGLARNVSDGIYEMHPLISSYLRARGAAPEQCQRAFVDGIVPLAGALTPLPFHEQRNPFLLFGASFHLALGLAGQLSMDQASAVLTQALAAYAQHTRNFGEASRLFARLVQQAAARGDLEGEASAYHQLGIDAELQRDFETAEEWYLKSLAISEKQGKMHGAAVTYHQLGRIAEQQRKFETARDWYLKSRANSEKEGNLETAAITYHHLGIVALEEREFHTAREWCLKSLAVSEKQDKLHLAATTYHQMGRIAEEEQDFETALKWYSRSLAINEKQGNLDVAAMTYVHLGKIAQMQQDFAKARTWCLKSLAISERQGDLHIAAKTYGQLGIIAGKQRDFEAAREWFLKALAINEKSDVRDAAHTYHGLGVAAGMQGRFEEAGRWLTRASAAFTKMHDQPQVESCTANFLFCHLFAPADVKQKLENIWHEAKLGPFPTGTQLMTTLADASSIHILKTIAHALSPTAPDLVLTPDLRTVLAAAFGNPPQAASEGDLARAALDLLAQDPAFAEPIQIMTRAAARVPAGGQRYLEPATIALTTAALLALQTRVKFKRDHTGKWSIEIEKKSASDGAIKLLVQRLLSLLHP